ncbi:cytochrome c3 family protein [Neobacillus sp. OS1-2]|uniref:multiheme c-type cytochrome n=1 Tax=Neobacillus sp. OS1-2 TaxID=3070680 RepID=UPI0027E122D9|nr:cytochrome c3 family protein [Neobacillus sp. OS1-2]WML41185.1 cytochrome c3 family protein [Neobacillus sp. OS1-2]
MKKVGLLHKTKLLVIIIFVLCIQLLGSQQLLSVTTVHGEELTGTDPILTITSPISDDFSNETNLTISGTVENFPAGNTITLYDGTKEIGTTSEITENSWSIPVTLTEGIHTITAKAEVEGKPISSNPIVNLIIDATAPTINVKEIKKNADGSTIVKGFVSDNLTKAENINMKLVYVDKNNQQNELEAIIPDSQGNWSITKNFPDKLNKYFLEASDNKEIDPKKFNQISIPIQRPYITSIKLSAFNYRHKIVEDGLSKDRDETVEVDILANEDMTRVVLNPTISIEFSDMPENISFPIYLFDNKGFVESAVPVKLNNHLQLTFKDPLKPGSTYYLMFNPSLISDKYKEHPGLFKDDVNNDFFPMIKKFTTVSSTVKDTPIDEFTAEYKNQPHGYYSNNTNTCANCHSTHVGDTSSLEKKELADNYCMSCHDGTVTAPLSTPMPDKINLGIKSKHETALVDNHKTKSGSCTSCHNPHLTWSPENPNLLTDHIIYTKTDKSKIDSLNTSCETCHQGDIVSVPKDYHTNSTVEVLSYKKINVLGSLSGNYSLCLRCHNADKNVDITKYYNDGESGHSLTALDGSGLNGPMPCAECHDTHGSENIKMLKGTLGHEGSRPFKAGNTDKNSFEVLNDSKEREFCQACHNGETAIYGVTGNKYDETIIEHKDNPDMACSYCHGRGDSEMERALSAAHGPKNGLVPTPK